MKVRISDLGEISTGNTPSKNESNYWNSKDVPFVKPDDLKDTEISNISKTHEYISNYGKEKARIASKGSILVTCIGSIGKVGIACNEVAFNQQINVIIPNKDFSSKYLAYAIYANKRKLQAIANAPVVPIINKTQFCNFELNIDMEIKKQLQIVRKLDCIFDLISDYKNQMQKLDLLTKSRFIEMFGDPIANSKKLVTVSLKDILVLKAGDFTESSNIFEEQSDSHPYPCYGGNGIRGFVSEYNQVGEYSLIGRQGALSGNIQYATGKFKNTEHALLVTPLMQMNSIWLNQLLINLDLKRYQTGAAQPGISVKNLQEIQIIMVPITEQNRFANFVQQVDKSKLAVQKSLEKTQQLFDSLMQEYFG